MISTFLRCSKYSCSVILRNVSDNVMGIDTEIDYTLLYPNQIHPDLDYFQNPGKAIHALDYLITELLLILNLLWRILGCPCEECKLESKIDNFLSYDIPKDFLIKITQAKISSQRESYLSRKHPTWDFFCNFSKGVTIIKSGILVNIINDFINRRSLEYFESDKGIFVKTEHVQNAIPISFIRTTRKILNEMEGRTLIDFRYVPFENAFLVLGNDYLLVKSCDVSHNTYRRLKDQIQERNTAESQFLFPPSSFVWESKLRPDRFEDMCLELLKR